MANNWTISWNDNLFNKKEKMSNKPLKLISYLLILLSSLSTSLAANMTIQQLIDSFDCNYYSGNLNITNQADYMVDRNGNGINDTLIINLLKAD